MRIFYGNNGGVFFFSRETLGSWRGSLEFYKGVSFSAKVKRFALMLAYPFLRDNCTLEEMGKKIAEATGTHIELTPNCAGIISPTGDKAVVHFPGRGYWKAATGKSYPGVKGEAEIYRLLAEKKPVKFGYSRISEIQDDGKTVSFWMSEEAGAFAGDQVQPLEAVLPALEEFHGLKPEGLVHGDFKPWNVRWRKDGRPQFFDFEECHAGSIEEDMEFYRTFIPQARACGTGQVSQARALGTGQVPQARACGTGQVSQARALGTGQVPQACASIPKARALGTGQVPQACACGTGQEIPKACALGTGQEIPQACACGTGQVSQACALGTGQEIPRHRTRMRIFVSAYACEPYYGSEPGIGWNFCNEMCKFHDVWVLTRANNQPAIDNFYTEHGGCPSTLHFLYYDVPKWLSFWKRKRFGYRQYYYLWQIGAYRKWRRFVNENDFDIVHHLTFANIAMPSLFMRCKPLTIWGPIGIFPIPTPIIKALPWRIRWAEKIRKGLMWCMMHLDPFRVTTERSADCIIEEPNRYFPTCFPKHPNVRYAYQTGLNWDDPDYVLPEVPPPHEGTVRLMICSEFWHWKGVDYSCEIFGRIAAKRDNVELEVYGRGLEEKHMREILGKYGVMEHVHWHGYVKKHEMLLALQENDILLYPTYHHGLATLVLQAMYAGIPMVGMAGDAVADTIADGIGLVAEGQTMPEILDDLERKTLQLIDSPELRERCVVRGRKLLKERFDWHVMVQKMCGLYEEEAARKGNKQ